MDSIATTEKAGVLTERLGKVVSGTPHTIGEGFTANHFSEEMFDGPSATTVEAGATTEIVMESPEPSHFVLMAAKPIREAFVKRGPLVMSTAEDVQETLAGYAQGKFGRIPTNPGSVNPFATRSPEHGANGRTLLRGGTSMSSVEHRENGPVGTIVFGISDSEREREQKLREQFAHFWSTATGEPRAIYDTFISASPLTEDVILEAVDDAKVQGWWVRPRETEPGQAILFVHGGGYVQGSAKAYRGFVSQIVSRTGIPALVIDYPLAPEATLPLAPQAALKAWRFLIDQGFERIAIVGDSAGGGLTLITLAELIRQPRGPAPIAGVAFSPWTDLAFTGASMTDANVVDPLVGYEYLRECARSYLGAANASDPLASPLYAELQGLPPLLIQVGTDECLLDDSRQFADRAARAGVPVQLEVWEGMHHVFQLDVAHLESSRAALDRAARFLRSAFAR